MLKFKKKYLEIDNYKQKLAATHHPGLYVSPNYNYYHNCCLSSYTYIHKHVQWWRKVTKSGWAPAPFLPPKYTNETHSTRFNH